MSLQDLKKKRDAAKAELEAEVKAFVQDKSKPLDERWQAFLDADVGSEDNWIQHFFKDKPKWKQWCRSDIEDYLYEHRNRGQEVAIADLDEQLAEMAKDEVEFELDGPTYETREEKRKVKFTKEDYDEWREDILALFMKSFSFDW